MGRPTYAHLRRVEHSDIFPLESFGTIAMLFLFHVRLRHAARESLFSGQNTDAVSRMKMLADGEKRPAGSDCFMWVKMSLGMHARFVGLPRN